MSIRSSKGNPPETIFKVGGGVQGILGGHALDVSLCPLEKLYFLKNLGLPHILLGLYLGV